MLWGFARAQEPAAVQGEPMLLGGPDLARHAAAMQAAMAGTHQPPVRVFTFPGSLVSCAPMLPGCCCRSRISCHFTCL
jgi:hypothetical protein